MNYAYPELPRRGLCNMLFPWAKAEAYCHQTGAVMLEPKWVSLRRIGPWLRGERYKRYYGNNFVSRGHITGLKRVWLLWFGGDRVRRFSGMSEWFDPILSCQVHIKEALWAITNRRIVREVESLAVRRFIAVHIRRGDFKQAGWLTNDEWYVKALKRSLVLWNEKGYKEEPYVRVFSDGHPDELRFLQLAVPNVCIEIMDKASPMRDLLLMSKSAVFVGSAQSTFSMWAVYLGQMPSIWAPAPLAVSPRLYVDDSYLPIVI